MQIFTDTTLAECYNVYCRINRKRVETFLNKIRGECVDVYSVKMQNMFDVTKSYFEDCDLQKQHKIANDESLALVCLFFSYQVSSFKNNLFRFTSTL